MLPQTAVALAFLLPTLAVPLSYFMSASLELVPWCVPHWDGCTSISRAARQGDTIFLFRILMFPYAVVLMIFWSFAYRWLKLLGDIESIRPRVMLCLGIVGALFLLVYVDFLGSSGEIYRLLRRYGVIYYFSLTGFAQLLLVSRLYYLFSRDKAQSLKRYARGMLACGVLLLVMCFCHLAASLHPAGDPWENVVEWNFAMIMTLYFLFVYQAWRVSGFTSYVKIK